MCTLDRSTFWVETQWLGSGKHRNEAPNAQGTGNAKSPCNLQGLVWDEPWTLEWNIVEVRGHPRDMSKKQIRRKTRTSTAKTSKKSNPHRIHHHFPCFKYNFLFVPIFSYQKRPFLAVSLSPTPTDPAFVQTAHLRGQLEEGAGLQQGLGSDVQFSWAPSKSICIDGIWWTLALGTSIFQFRHPINKLIKKNMNNPIKKKKKTCFSQVSGLQSRLGPEPALRLPGHAAAVLCDVGGDGRCVRAGHGNHHQHHHFVLKRKRWKNVWKCVEIWTSLVTIWLKSNWRSWSDFFKKSFGRSLNHSPPCPGPCVAATPNC